MPFPNIDPIALELGPLVIRWYALSYIAGIVLAYFYIGKLNARFPYFNEEARDDLITYAVIGIILGGRIGYVLFYNFEYFLHAPLDALKIWQGGMSFHGGLLGIFTAFWLYARKHTLNWLRIMDYLAAATPIGLCLGRLANFINGELYGRVTDSAWGMVFPQGGSLPRHPSQLYQAAGEGLLLFLMLYVLIHTTNIMRYRGAVGGLFLAGYGVARFAMEFFREPDPQLGFLFGEWLTMGQLLCVPMILVGAWLLLRARQHKVI